MVNNQACAPGVINMVCGTTKKQIVCCGTVNCETAQSARCDNGQMSASCVSYDTCTGYFVFNDYQCNECGA